MSTTVERPVGGSSPAPAPLGTGGTLRWLWRQLTSMRTALLLLLLAVATIPGSLFPQNGVDRGAVNAYLRENPRTGPWLERLGLFDVYASPWFAAVYLLLFVSLLGCIVPRARAHAAEWRRRPPRTPRRLDRLPEHRTATVGADVDEVARRVTAALRRPGWRGGGGPLLGHRVDRHTEEDSHGTPGGPQRALSLAAETGRLRETGNLLFHVSLIGVLVAMAVGSLYSYRGEALVVEGSSFSNVLPAYDSITPGARFDTGSLPPFSFRLDSLDVAFEEEQANQIGSPRDFRASVAWSDDLGASEQTGTVRVNEPLHVGETSVYLTGNGYAPEVQVRDGEGVVRFDAPVPFLPEDASYTSRGVVKAPVPGAEDIGLSGWLLPTAGLDPVAEQRSFFPDARIPRLVLSVWVGDIGLGDGSAQSVYALDTDDMTQVAGEDGEPLVLLLEPGETVELPDGLGSVTFGGLPRFAAFQVRADPSGPLALGSASLAILGLVMSLFLPRRRLWVRLTPEPVAGGRPRTVVQVAGLSRSRDVRLGDEVERVLAAADGEDRPQPPAAAPGTSGPGTTAGAGSTSSTGTTPRHEETSVR